MLPEKTYCVGCQRYGGPDELAVYALPMPTPGERQALVEVSFTAVNPADVWMLSGGLDAALEGPRPYVGGHELAGTIVAVGPGSRWRVGDRVAAITSFIPTGRGSHCRHVVVDDDSVARVPPGLGLAEAAALPMSGLTAQNALDRAAAAGRRIAITGAAGAVGSLTLHLAMEAGLEPIAIVRQSQVEAVRASGAPNVVASEDVPEAVLALAPEGVDGVIDTALIGAAILPALRDGGCFVAVRPVEFALERGITMERPTALQYRHEQAKLDRLLKLSAAGKLPVNVAVTLPPEQGGEGYRLVEKGGQGGRVMLDFASAKPPA